MNIKAVNLGELIRLRVESLGISKSKFAESLNIARQNIEKTVFSKHSIDTDLLCAICNVLDCNFFDYFQDEDEKRNQNDYKPQVVKATISIEMGTDKQDKQFRFVFGDNKLEIK